MKGAARVTAFNVPRPESLGSPFTFLDDLDAEPKTY